LSDIANGLKPIERAVKEHGAEVVVLGCCGFIGLSGELSRKAGIPVIDPAITTLKAAEALTKLGLKHLKIKSPHAQPIPLTLLRRRAL
jgi:allantoin racemase